MAERVRVATATIAPAAGGTDRRVTARAMRAGIWIWPAFVLLDAYMCFVAYPVAPFRLFLVYRVAVWVAFFVVYRASLREDADPDRLFSWQGQPGAILDELARISTEGSWTSVDGPRPPTPSSP